jgi:hypothetical protein
VPDRCAVSVHAFDFYIVVVLEISVKAAGVPILNKKVFAQWHIVVYAIYIFVGT